MTGPQAKRESQVGLWLVFAGLGLLGYAIGLVVLHALQWLRYGEWPKFQTFDFFFRFGLAWPLTEWGGVQKIIDWLMNQSVAGNASALGIALLCIGAARLDK